MVPTRVHERYGYPFFAMGVILAAISVRWRIAYIVLSVATFANMYVVLTTIYPNNPSIADWLRIGPTIRDPAGVVVLSLLHGVAFVWAFVQLRSGAHRRLGNELLAASVVNEADQAGDELLEDDTGLLPGPAAAPLVATAAMPVAPVAAGTTVAAARAASPAALAAPAAVAPPPPLVPAPAVAATAATAALPRWTPRPGFDQLGVIGWFRSRLTEAPLRPDRSALLRGEGGGRLDKLDLRIVVVLIVGLHGPARIPAGRALPDALRRGLSRPDGYGVPPGVAVRHLARHLRMDPSALGQVRDGRRAGPVGPGQRQRHERPGRAGGRGHGRAQARRRARAR